MDLVEHSIYINIGGVQGVFMRENNVQSSYFEDAEVGGTRMDQSPSLGDDDEDL